jgi:hypothetical protein
MRRILLLALGIALGIAATPTAVHGNWSASSITIKSTSAGIGLIEGCSDGAYGAYVAWQELTTPTAGLLRVQHVLLEILDRSEITLPGTSDLASVLYFARATAGTEVFRGKVLVTR